MVILHNKYSFLKEHFLDAFCKAKSGDESELNDLIQQRENIKKEFPKE